MISSANNSLRAIVFDFDGVVLESADVKTEAFVDLFAEHGAEVQQRVLEHHLANLGISRFKKFAWIYANVLGQPLSDEHSAVLGDRFSALALDKVLAAPFVAGAREALEALAAHYPLYVASGTPQGELDDIVERRGLRGFFREVHGSPREKPAILTDLMMRNDWTPSQVLFVGDGMSDYKAAKAVGTRFLARITPPLRDEWQALAVTGTPDMQRLVEIVTTWPSA